MQNRVRGENPSKLFLSGIFALSLQPVWPESLAAVPSVGPAVGILLPAQGPAAGLAEEARRGIEMALERARIEGPGGGRAVRNVERTADGLWGRGNEELVRLAYDDGVVGVIGGLNSASAHVALQVAAKARLPVLTPWASCTGVTQTGVPWVFQVVPDDREQAEVIGFELGSRRGLKSPVVFCGGGRDDRCLAETFVESWANSVHSRPVLLEWLGGDLPADLDRRLESGEWDSFVLCLQPTGARAALDRLRRLGVSLPGFGGLVLSGLASTAESPRSFGDFTSLAAVIFDAEFLEDYTRRHGHEPGPLAAYGFDAASVLLAAVRKGGNDRLAVRAALASMKFQGVTGAFRFDSRGRRVSEGPVLEVRRPSDVGKSP